jgi:hypothetical protein
MCRRDRRVPFAQKPAASRIAREMAVSGIPFPPVGRRACQVRLSAWHAGRGVFGPGRCGGCTGGTNGEADTADNSGTYFRVGIKLAAPED